MNTNNYIIRLEKKTEQRQVENLVRESFWNVYRPGCYEHYVLHVLRDDKDFVPELNFVMEKDGEIIGQTVFVKAKIKADIMRAVRVIDAFGSELSGFKKFIELSVPIDTEITEEDIQQWTEFEVDPEVLENCPMEISPTDVHNIYYNALINKNRDYKRW